jgi:ABC-type spermidine/putrescine transport system permease subunit II
MSMRGLRTAFAFCFILAAADYVAPRMVGGLDGQMIGSIIADQFGGASNYPFGATLSIAMIAGFCVILGSCYLVERLLARASRLRFWRCAGNRRFPVIPNIPLTETVTLLSLLFLFAPLLTVFVFSFNNTPNPGLPFTGFTLRWYVEVIGDPQFHRVLSTSLQIGTICVVSSMLLGVPAAIALARRRFALRWPTNLLVFAPMAVPGVVMGVALLATFVTLDIQLGQMTAAAAHVMLVIPFVVQVIRTRLEKIDQSIEEAAHDLGSPPLRVLRTVTLPILLPAIIGSGMLAAAISLDELLVTNFTIGRGATIPVWIASQMRIGLTPALNAVAILMLVGTLGLLGLASVIMRWKERRANPTAAREKA